MKKRIPFSLEKFIITVFVGLLAIALTCNLYAGEPAVIVTVDGLSFANTLLPGSVTIEESNQYLKTALETMNLDLAETTIVDFTWSRDADDTLETVEDLRAFLQEKYREAQTANKRFIIVAHSWGTVLSYLALASQSGQVPENERVYVDLYITLGSPLGTDNAHDGANYLEETIVINYTANWLNQYDFCGTCLPLVEKWRNYWAWGDVISGPFQGFMPFDVHPQWTDIQIDSISSVGGYAGRNTATTVVWHLYDSLQPGGIIDNQPLLDEVKRQIEDSGPVMDDPPFGSFDTPLQDSTVRGSVPVTGWALDDAVVESVKIYREPVNGEGKELIYIGDAAFVEGARPDIQQAYPGYPNNSRAGWGYMMLTNFLPNQGNGAFTLHAVAADSSGHQATLGTKTITCDNANAVKPFGAIDTPVQGGTASGGDFINWGWVLTPLPNSIPVDGSTINVFVDGVNLGHPAYNNYRADIAALFPGYTNSNGAVGYFYLDTTAYENGVHTIQWTAADSAGNTDGIGSRYFTIQNTAGHVAWRARRECRPPLPDRTIPIDYSTPVSVKKGYNRDTKPQIISPDHNGIITIEIKELQCLEIHFPNSRGSILNVSSLPIGSTLDTEGGVFYWSPGAGFVGNYRFTFVDISSNRLRRINIRIYP